MSTNQSIYVTKILNAIEKVKAVSPNADRIVVVGLSSLVYQGQGHSTHRPYIAVSNRTFTHLFGNNVIDNMVDWGDCYIIRGTPISTIDVDGVVCSTVRSEIERAKLQVTCTQLVAAATALNLLNTYEDYQKGVELKASLNPIEPAVKPDPFVGVEFTDDELKFLARCTSADWYYQFSDDIRVYRSGNQECSTLQGMASALGGNYALIYKHCSK